MLLLLLLLFVGLLLPLLMSELLLRVMRLLRCKVMPLADFGVPFGVSPPLLGISAAAETAVAIAPACGRRLC